MNPAEPARTALLDAAERLFALAGIAQVSDRRVADEAGNTNHSAVRYYFGGRDGLLRALLLRHTTELDAPRAAMFAYSDSVLGDIRSLVMPTMTVLDQLPRPSWRARFLSQALNDPGIRALVAETTDAASATMLIRQSLCARLEHLDRAVVTARASLITRIMVTAAAEVETRAERDGQDPRWASVGDFLCDAIAGMLLAPITRPGDPNPLTAVAT
ncbi:TetR/AcrR family transcriptional regulator [Actinoplanes awajinensis]|uniref:Transcriptional regulator n=1 Tax=Actinoplanes awajinensis subsp. mycoplanecinus TaxID=135947 RepID=A0A124G8D7_9ACTN|nr:TetR/AcrR family transcriptional regulator [Actinoplanes awajinensis]KUL25585.1 transcriptional regulator [Actinoplanes awajinensis subsp. mycoplanecinus]